MKKTFQPMEYEDFLEKYPDWVLLSTATFAREATPELTERSRLRFKKKVGIFLAFIQQHGLVSRTLCEAAPDIPDDFSILLKDVTPEGLGVFRQGFLKWISRLDRNINSDLNDIRELEKSLLTLKKSEGKGED